MTRDLDRFLVRAGPALVLSGAGMSTDSGIPDYRGASSSRRPRGPLITYQEFVRDAEARRRYWARSHVGWARFAAARPNAGHVAVAGLEAQGRVSGVVTQNVDRLHTAAGSREVVDLHGRLDVVVCLGCGDHRSRVEVALRLAALNPGFERHAERTLRPDGDADLPPDAVAGFRVAHCRRCGGLLKPDVVLFGESVPPARLAAAMDLLSRSRSLLVLGSSLAVFSGYRFVRRARALGLPVAIVTLGETRADAEADLRIDRPLAEVLGALTSATV